MLPFGFILPTHRPELRCPIPLFICSIHLLFVWALANIQFYDISGLASAVNKLFVLRHGDLVAAGHTEKDKRTHSSQWTVDGAIRMAYTFGQKTVRDSMERRLGESCSSNTTRAKACVVAVAISKQQHELDSASALQ